MKLEATRSGEIALEVGADRVVSPRGSLPQPAEVLDASGPVRSHEFEIAVERICLDSTSHRQLAESADGAAGAMAARVQAIVAARGKMHNPITDSGGILTGTVSAVGDDFPDPPRVGARVATLASLTLIPLRLESVDDLDPASAQLGVRGTAYVCPSVSWAEMPGDLSAEKALEVFDVCAAASQTRALVTPGGTVCVLGAGHAGKLALAAARDASPDSTLVVADVDHDAVALACDLGLADMGVATDLRDPLRAVADMRGAGVPPADLAVVVVNAAGCEAAAILMTARRGRILFFSMATSFGTAALTADGLASEARMVIGSGFSPDHGEYALGLVRTDEALRRALGIELVGVA